MPLKYFEEFEKHAAEHPAKVIPEPDQQQLSLVPLVLKGRPFVEIIRCAQNHEMDLILVGTHGRGPWAHVMMGNVAENVRHALVLS